MSEKKETMKIRFRPNHTEKLGVFYVSGNRLDLSDGAFHNVDKGMAVKLLTGYPDNIEIKKAQKFEDIVEPDVKEEPEEPKEEETAGDPDPELIKFAKEAKKSLEAMGYKDLKAKADKHDYSGKSRKKDAYVEFLLDLAIQVYLSEREKDNK